MTPTHVVYPGVELALPSELGEFVLIGVVPKQKHDEPLATSIGEGAAIRSHSVIYAGSVIGARFQTGHGALIREFCSIGDDVSIGSHAVVEHHVTIGCRVRIHSNAFIPEFSRLEDECWIGPGVVLTNARYPASSGAKHNLAGPRVGRGARIGAGAILLPGVAIGPYALVGAGALVTGDVPERKLVVGNPARVVKDVSELRAYGPEVD